MKTLFYFSFVFPIVWGFFLVVSFLQADEKMISSTIKSVGLFKNGVVVVQEEIDVPRSGCFILEQVPAPIHGTFFLESDAVVETMVSQREITEPMDESQSLYLQKDLAGQNVKVYFYHEKAEPVMGRVVEIPEADPNRMRGRARTSAPVVSSQFPYPPEGAQMFRNGLLLDTAEGRTYLTTNSVFYRIDTEKTLETVRRKRTVMIFDVKTDNAAKIRLFYLTKGITWAPSYRVDITHPTQLTIEQTTVIMNELQELKDTEILLISGFPKIECENVNSPISPGSSIAAFFQQLSQRTRPNSSPMMTQQAVFTSNTAIPSSSFPEFAAVDVAGEGPDIHFQNIGKRSMNVGDVLSLSNGKATTEYERVVEWSDSDSRDAWGRYQDNNRQPTRDTDPWDILRFSNPLPFPMTTAAATIVSNQQFFGQNTSYWASPKQMTKIPITKSMSVRVHSTELERMNEVNKPAPPKVVTIDGHTYREAMIDVELTIVNHRAELVKMSVKRRFYGELEKEIDGATIRLLAENLNAVNRQHEIQWEFDLPSGEAKKWAYSYVVLIRR